MRHLLGFLARATLSRVVLCSNYLYLEAVRNEEKNFMEVSHNFEGPDIKISKYIMNTVLFL